MKEIQDFKGSFRKIYFSFILLVITTLLGVLGFIWIERHSILDAVYMTVITMSTVGYGTIGELSTSGKIFAIGLIITSTSIFVYTLTTLTTFIIEGEVNHFFQRYRTGKKVQKMKDHIIICGLGRNGREAALELVWQGIPFVAIEQDQEMIEKFISQYKALAIRGDATQEEVLEMANIHSAKALICALPSDADNVFITLTAREMNPSLKIIARATNESSISKLKRAGATQVVLPHMIGGRKMANLITRPVLTEFIDMITGQGNPNTHVEDVSCDAYPNLANKTLSELDIRGRTGVTVIGRKRKDQKIELNLPDQTHFEPGDQLYVWGTEEQLKRFRDEYL